MHRLARVTERRDHLDEGPRGDRRRAFDPRRVVTVVEDEATGGAWVHLALRDEWEEPTAGPARVDRHEGCRAMLTRELYNEVLHEIDSAMRGFPVASFASLSDPVSALDLSSRARNSLASARIKTIDHLCRLSAAELLDVRRFGRVCLSEVRERLAERGLALRDDS